MTAEFFRQTPGGSGHEIFSLVHCHKQADLSKLSITDAAHHHQMFRATKQSESLSMDDDSFGESFSDAGQPFKFRSRGRIDIDAE